MADNIPRIEGNSWVAGSEDLRLAKVPYPNRDTVISRDSFLLIGSPGDAGTNSPQDRRDHAIHRYRRDKSTWRANLKDLKRAAPKTNDWETYYWIGKIASDNNLLEEAFPAARKSLELAVEKKKKDETEKSKTLVNYLEKTFAPVVLEQSPRQAEEVERGYLELEPSTPFINLQKRRCLMLSKNVWKKDRSNFQSLSIFHLETTQQTVSLSPLDKESKERFRPLREA